jgi:quercetin dioxygenase-like cupin family protein
MKWQIAAGLLLVAVFTSGQTGSQAVIVTKESAKWVHEAKDPPGSESVFLREDPATGGVELLVSYPPGHVFAPHWHDSNERIVVTEGTLTFGDQSVGSGGYAFLPAKEVQRGACTSKTKCVFYVSWDGSPKSHPAK